MKTFTIPYKKISFQDLCRAVFEHPLAVRMEKLSNQLYETGKDIDDAEIDKMTANYLLDIIDIIRDELGLIERKINKN